MLFISQLHCGKLKITSHIPKRKSTDTQGLFKTKYSISYDLPENPDKSIYFEEPEFGGKFKIVTGFGCLDYKKMYTLTLVNSKNKIMSDNFNVAIDSGSYISTSDYDENITVKSSKLCFTWGTWIPRPFNTEGQGQVFFNFLNNISLSNEQIFFHINSVSFIQGADITLKLVSHKSKNLTYDSGTHSIIQYLKCLDTNQPKGSTIEKQGFDNVFKLGDTTFTFKGDGDFQIYLPITSTEKNDAEAAINQTILNNKPSGNRQIVGWKNLQCENTNYKLIRGALAQNLILV